VIFILGREELGRRWDFTVSFVFCLLFCHSNYLFNKGVILESDDSGTPVASSYGWATPRDYARWGNAQLKTEWTKSKNDCDLVFNLK
jgi:hypothetical protein